MSYPTLHPIYKMISDYFTQNIPAQFDSIVDRDGLHIRSLSEKWICHFLISSNKASISVESHNSRFHNSFILRHPIGYNDSQYYLEVAQQLSLFAMPYIQHKSYPSAFYSRLESIQNKLHSLVEIESHDVLDIDSFCRDLGHILHYDFFDDQPDAASWLFIKGGSVRLSGEPGDLYLKFNDDSVDYTFDSGEQSVDGTINITTYSDTLKRLLKIINSLIKDAQSDQDFEDLMPRGDDGTWNYLLDYSLKDRRDIVNHVHSICSGDIPEEVELLLK